MNRISTVMIVLVLSAVAVGDILVTSSGKTYEGKLIQKTDTEVVFEVHMKNGLRFEKTFPAKDVAVEEADLAVREISVETITSTSSPKHTFYYITIKGGIGTDIHRELFKKWKKDVLEKKPDILILEIDSPGGHVSETEAIIKDLKEMQKGRLYTIAYVKNAFSAGAVIAMTCQYIYMEPQAAIGAVTPWMFGPDGTPEAVEEKFKSAFRGKFQAAIEIGGHQIEFADAMIYASAEYHITQKDGKPFVERGIGAKMLTANGKLLTMSPKQAIESGLVKKILNSQKELLDLEKIKLKDEMGGLKIWEIRRKKVREAKKQWKKLDKAFERVLTKADANRNNVQPISLLRITRKMVTVHGFCGTRVG